MDSLFAWLSQAVEGAAGVALFASMVWGVLSILLSPCHLASIPLVVGFVNRQGGELTTRRAFVLSTLFAGGILATIAVIGAATAALGRMMGDIGPWGSYVVAIVFVLVGLYLLDILPIPWSGGAPKAIQRKGMLAALLLGLLFGVAVGPCTFAYMAPILAGGNFPGGRPGAALRFVALAGLWRGTRWGNRPGGDFERLGATVARLERGFPGGDPVAACVRCVGPGRSGLHLLGRYEVKGKG